MPKTKSTRKRSKLTLTVKPRFKFDKTVALAILAALVVTSGYLLYKGAHATSNITPHLPFKYTEVQQIDVGKLTTSDGVTGTFAWCFNNLINSSFGYATYCANSKPNSSTIRFGNYNVPTTKFYPGTAWLKVMSGFNGLGWDSNTKTYFFKHVGSCKNNSAQFFGLGPVDGGLFGPLYYGEMFRYYSGRWQEQWTNKSSITGNCSDSGQWYTVLGTIDEVLGRVTL